MRHPLITIAATALATAIVAVPASALDSDKLHAGHAATDPALAAAIADPARKPENRARDAYRHPAETLTFFGVKPDQTIVEFYPGGGWYTEILAPYVKDKGKYVALASSSEQAQTRTRKLLDDNKARFGETTLAGLDPAAGTSTVAPASADVILTFRNVHNLMMNGEESAAGAFRAFYAALKPGGTLGVVDHRLPEARDSAEEKKSGYIKRSTVVRLAEAAGFKLAGESEINANPKDTADHAKGVWTLPPSLDAPEADKAKYKEIGESDRMTLKFTKPAA